MRYVVIIPVLLFAACVSGDPVAPDYIPCKEVRVYTSWQDSTLVTDSIVRVPPDCTLPDE